MDSTRSAMLLSKAITKRLNDFVRELASLSERGRTVIKERRASLVLRVHSALTQCCCISIATVVPGPFARVKLLIRFQKFVRRKQ